MKDEFVEECKKLLRFHGSMTSYKLRQELGYKVKAYTISMSLRNDDMFEKVGKKNLGDRSYAIWSLKE